MRFSDFFPTPSRKLVGRILSAEWDEAEHGIRFQILFEPSGRRIEGVCRAGQDPVSGAFISERELKAKLPQFKELQVYENALSGDPNTISPSEFEKLKIEISLTNLTLGYQGVAPKPDANSFIARMFK